MTKEEYLEKCAEYTDRIRVLMSDISELRNGRDKLLVTYIQESDLVIPYGTLIEVTEHLPNGMEYSEKCVVGNYVSVADPCATAIHGKDALIAPILHRYCKGGRAGKVVHFYGNLSFKLLG